jgi:hypothetical protein
MFQHIACLYGLRNKLTVKQICTRHCIVGRFHLGNRARKRGKLLCICFSCIPIVKIMHTRNCKHFFVRFILIDWVRDSFFLP